MACLMVDCMSDLSSKLGLAANLIRGADALLITAGAGMGADSGLPDFRGDVGFWKAYPALARAGTSFVEAANPQHFEDNPKRAWGFYGHRLNLYRATEPHEGFAILKKWIDARQGRGFVLTSNVDGQFQKAGFDEDKLFEIHGSIHHLQCTAFNCRSGIWTADELKVEVDEARCQLISQLPKCPNCEHLARPNILMFDDWKWKDERTLKQQTAFQQWMFARKEEGHKVVTIELGAGTQIATVRWQGDHLPYDLIRINPVDEFLSFGKKGVGLRGGALNILPRIERLINYNLISS